MRHNTEAQHLLDDHIQRISGVRGAVVLSDEGTHMYWSLIDEATAERRAPMASTLGHLANRYAIEERCSSVRRVLIDTDDGYITVSRVGALAYLALSVEASANLGTVAYEAGLLSERLSGVLDASLRVPDPGRLA